MVKESKRPAMTWVTIFRHFAKVYDLSVESIYNNFSVRHVSITSCKSLWGATGAQSTAFIKSKRTTGLFPAPTSLSVLSMQNLSDLSVAQLQASLGLFKQLVLRTADASSEESEAALPIMLAALAATAGGNFSGVWDGRGSSAMGAWKDNAGE